MMVARVLGDRNVCFSPPKWALREISDWIMWAWTSSFAVFQKLPWPITIHKSWTIFFILKLKNGKCSNFKK